MNEIMFNTKLGAIVHYTSLGDSKGIFAPEQVPAMITKVRSEDKVCLKIFYPAGQFDRDYVPYSEKYEPGHWSWPP